MVPGLSPCRPQAGNATTDDCDSVTHTVCSLRAVSADAASVRLIVASAMIHGDNPFTASPDQRDPVRRFRGRLTAPVAIVTSGTGDARTGLTVSSLMVIEGEPGLVQMVVGPTSDLWHVAEESKAFVIHVCREDDRDLAQVFAGLRPNPGGVFAGLDIVESEHGPVIARLANRAFCSFVEKQEMGYSGLVTGEIETVEAASITDPLVYFRGGYRGLS